MSGAPDLFRMEKVGESVEGRALNLVQAGTGAFRVMLWSQMHGDEPTATAALFDLFEYLRRHRQDPAVRGMLSSLTLYFLPMLNPDGAERFQRRNAQSIDINRDALRLQTPEGRTLKAVRDRFQPRIGFNLHNQSWRTSVGDAAEAGVDFAAVGRLRRSALGERRADAHEEGLRDHPRCARAVRLRARSAATTTSSRCGRSATTSRCGARRWC